MLHCPVHIVFATAEPAACQSMIDSIEHHLAGRQLTFSAVLFGDRCDELGLAENVEVIYRTNTFLPIHKSRNLCQQHLQRMMRSHGGIGLVLDDDLQWIMAEGEFAVLCQTLTDKGCDMAFVQLAGDPPIPKEYTRASPLLDVLLEMHNKATFTLPDVAKNALNRVVQQRCGNEFEHQHHDFYAYNPECFVATDIDLASWDSSSFITRLAIGKATTRPVKPHHRCVVANGRERGGATIIFNPAMLNYQNLAITMGDYCSRRSDMMMARQAFFAGACLFSVPAILRHNRVFGFDAIGPKKLIGDMLGYALVEVYQGHQVSGEDIRHQFEHRLTKTQKILADTSMMLHWLRHALTAGQWVGATQIELIEQMLRQNQATLSQLGGLSIDLDNHYLPLK